MAGRGTMSPKDAIDACMERSCCFATGMELKVFNSLQKVEGVDREVASCSLGQCINAFYQEYNRKGGCDNAEIERDYSLLWSLGVVRAKDFSNDVSSWVWRKMSNSDPISVYSYTVFKCDHALENACSWCKCALPPAEDVYIRQGVKYTFHSRQR